MSRVKKGFAGLSVPEQIERARMIKGKLTGNPNYVTPVPSLIFWDGQIIALEDAYNDSRNHDKEKVAIMRIRRREMLDTVDKLAAYVQVESGGDEEKILSSGFDVVGPRTSHPSISGPVTDIRLSSGSSNGTIRVDFNKAVNAVNHIIFASLAENFSNPVLKGVTKKSHTEIGVFAAGTKVWVKIVPLGREELGPESEPVFIFVR